MRAVNVSAIFAASGFDAASNVRTALIFCPIMEFKLNVAKLS